MAKKTAYEIVMEDRKKLVDKLIENMKKGYFITNEKWNVTAMLPQNPVSNVCYKGGNRLKLALEAVDKEYKDPRWMTFKQAKDKGWSVKKGEHGVLCEKWIFSKKEKQKDVVTGEEKEIDVELERPVVNYFTVFNGEQVEGIPPYQVPNQNLDKSEIMEIINDFISSSEAKIKEVAQHRAYYDPENDEIVLPLREVFKSEEAFMRTTMHEMCHSTGHKDRLNRDMSGEFGTSNYAREELVAELGSLFTESSLGIKIEGEHFNDHSNYLKSWIETLKKDYNELFRACAEAEKASTYLVDRYHEKQLEELQEINNTPIKKDILGKLGVTFHWSEYDFGIKEDTPMRGERAYKFLEKMINIDIEQNKRQKFLERELEKGNKINEFFYYKTQISLRYGATELKDHVRIDLGDLEFGGKTKVSDALEYRLNLHTNDLIKNAVQHAEMINKIVDSQEKQGAIPIYERTTPEKIIEEANEVKKETKEIIGHFREKENVYLTSKINNKEVLNSRSRKRVKENINER